MKTADNDIDMDAILDAAFKRQGLTMPTKDLLVGTRHARNVTQEQARIYKLKSLVKQGSTRQQISSEMRVTDQTVARLMKRHGIRASWSRESRKS